MAESKTKLPATLNTDRDWADLIAWLQDESRMWGLVVRRSGAIQVRMK